MDFFFPQTKDSGTIIHLGRVVVVEGKEEKAFLEREILPGIRSSPVTPNTKSIVAQNLPFFRVQRTGNKQAQIIAGSSWSRFQARQNCVFIHANSLGPA